MQTRNFAEEFQSCRRRSHGDGGENLCLCCSRDSLGAYGIPPNLKCGRGGRQRIPRDERPKPPLLCERDRKFESISLQQRVQCEPDFLSLACELLLLVYAESSTGRARSIAGVAFI